MTEQRGSACVRGIREGVARLSWVVNSRLAIAGGMDALDQRARDRQRHIVRWARVASPFYRELYRGLPPTPEPFSDLPPVTKPQLMARFDDWLTDPDLTREGLRPWLRDPANIGSLYLGKALVYTTSGTTGEPAILVQDRLALSHYVASRTRILPAILDRDVVTRIVRGHAHTAALLATGGPYGGVVMAEWLRRRHPLARNLKILAVGDPLAATVAALNRWQPTVLSGYASALVLLADEAAAGRLTIDPALVASTAEGLSAEGRARIRAAWETLPIDAYGASEAPVIAYGCRHGNLHLNLDWVTLEPVDASYRPVPAGVASHTVLITNHVNRVQPIIRYDLGDSVTIISDPCVCGSPLPVIRVEGRSGDVLALAAPNGEIVRLLPLAVGSEVEEAEGVRRVQVIQIGPASLLVKIEALAGADRETVALGVQRRLEAFLRRHGLANVAVSISRELPQAERSGKFRQVFRQTAPESGVGVAT